MPKQRYSEACQYLSICSTSSLLNGSPLIVVLVGPMALRFAHSPLSPGGVRSGIEVIVAAVLGTCYDMARATTLAFESLTIACAEKAAMTSAPPLDLTELGWSGPTAPTWHVHNL